MSATDTLKKLIALGLPDQWLIPVLNAITGPTKKTATKRRKRRTKAQMAADAAKGRKRTKVSA